MSKKSFASNPALAFISSAQPQSIEEAEVKETPVEQPASQTIAETSVPVINEAPKTEIPAEVTPIVFEEKEEPKVANPQKAEDPKRGRGRPKKTEASKETSKTAKVKRGRKPAKATKNKAYVDDQPAEISSKRRGRPRKTETANTVKPITTVSPKPEEENKPKQGLLPYFLLNFAPHERKSLRVNLLMKPSLVAKLKEVSASQFTSMNDLISKILEEVLKNY